MWTWRCLGTVLILGVMKWKQKKQEKKLFFYLMINMFSNQVVEVLLFWHGDFLAFTYPLVDISFNSPDRQKAHRWDGQCCSCSFCAQTYMKCRNNCRYMTSLKLLWSWCSPCWRPTKGHIEVAQERPFWIPQLELRLELKRPGLHM